MRAPVTAATAAAILLAAGAPARAGVAGWRLSEALLAGDGGDAQVRFVEVHAADGGCWYATTQLVVFDGAGQPLDVAAPFVETTCFEGETYLLFATAAAEVAFGVSADRPAVPTFPGAARQLCLRSTTTVYDCVRWDGVTVPVHDLFGPDDDSTAASPPAGLALARIADTDVIADDWIVADPTPRAPNDGTPWTPPDAGVGPDAGGPDGGVPDAAVPDAGSGPDAGPRPDATIRPDARDDRFLDLDAQGGAGCGCRAGGGATGAPLLALLILVGRTRRVTREAARGSQR